MTAGGSDNRVDPPCFLTAHAVAALAERGIDFGWVDRVLRHRNGPNPIATTRRFDTR